MKILPDGEWLAISTSDISGGQTPDQTSQITGATYTGGNWNPDGDQWLYYST